MGHRKSIRSGMAFLLGISVVILGVFLAGVLYGRRYGVPLVRKYQDWSIGVLGAESPLLLHPLSGVSNPVLRASDVTDVEALFVADPFLLQHDDGYVMFFEVLSQRDGNGVIAMATSEDGVEWTYGAVVLDEPFHLSYPYVFQWAGETYMVPESAEALGVFLYRAERFPYEWVQARTLLRGRYVDPSLIYKSGRWWLFVAETQNDILRLFSAASLDDRFVEHPDSPLVVGNETGARPAGRLLHFNGRLFRPSQDDAITYGRRICLFEILTLTPEEYREVPIHAEWEVYGAEWNAAGMHHLDTLEQDSGEWLAVADGWSRWRLAFGWR
jgi:hypothetical protein